MVRASAWVHGGLERYGIPVSSPIGRRECLTDRQTPGLSRGQYERLLALSPRVAELSLLRAEYRIPETLNQDRGLREHLQKSAPSLFRHCCRSSSASRGQLPGRYDAGPSDGCRGSSGRGIVRASGAISDLGDPVTLGLEFRVHGTESGEEKHGQ